MQPLPQLFTTSIVVALAACSVTPVTFTQLPKITIGGTITGIDGAGLVLINNDGDELAISGNGAFAFTTPVELGASYTVTVKSQPSNPTQVCSIANGNGTAGDEDVTDVQVICHTSAFSVGGMVSGLAGLGLVLQSNSSDDLAMNASGTFSFATPVAGGAPFAVTVKTQPYDPWQTCTVAAGAGTVTNADVTGVVVTCTTNLYRVGGAVSGLGAGNSITLRNNGGDDLVLTGNGSFAFRTLLASLQMYRVTLLANPTSPISQNCFLLNNSDSVFDHDIDVVFVMCQTNRFTIGGTVSGLTGTGLVVQDRFSGEAAITGNGAFTLPFSLPSGTPYSVTVKTQPSGQTCTVTSGAGTLGASNVTSVQVTC